MKYASRSAFFLVLVFLCRPLAAQNTRPSFVTPDSIGYHNIVCGNVGENLPVDSMAGPWPYESFSATNSELSPDGRYLATWLYTNPDFPLLDGLLIYDVVEKRVVEFLEPHANLPRWSPDGSMLVCSSFIYDFVGRRRIPFPSQSYGTPAIPVWSVDGEKIFFSLVGSSGMGPPMFCSTKDGKLIGPIETSKYGAQPISMDEMIYFENHYDGKPKGYTIYNITNNTSRFVSMPDIVGYDIGGVRRYKVSPNKRLVVADIQYRGGSKYNGKRVLGFFDLLQNRYRPILPAQSWGNLYDPSWSSDSTIVISFHCRLDSSCTAWEIDTNGRFIRQLIGKESMQMLLDARTVDNTPSTTTITLFPQPALDNLVIECSMQRHGRYTLAIVDVLGREVRRVWDNEESNPGKRTATVSTSGLPPGLYFLRLAGSRTPSQYKKFLKQ